MEHEGQNQGAAVRGVGAGRQWGSVRNPSAQHRRIPGQRAASTVQPTAHLGRLQLWAFVHLHLLSPARCRCLLQPRAQCSATVGRDGDPNLNLKEELRRAGKALKAIGGQGVSSQLNRGSRPGNPESNLKPKEPHFPICKQPVALPFPLEAGLALSEGCGGHVLSGPLLLSQCSTHRDGLLFDAAHRQHFACEGDLARHGQVLPHWPVQSQGEQGRDNGAAGARAVLGGGTLQGDGQVGRQPVGV